MASGYSLRQQGLDEIEQAFLANKWWYFRPIPRADSAGLNYVSSPGLS
jgi:hypothetical protein